MNNTPSLHKYQGRSLEDLKSSLRAVNHQIDKMRMDAAETLGIFNTLCKEKPFWTADEINWDDPKIVHLKPKFFHLLDTAYELEHIAGKLEATQNGTLEQFEIYEKIDKFLATNFKTFEEEVEFFRKNNLVAGLSSLREAVLENPNFLEEVIL